MAVLLEELVNQHRDQLSKSEKEVLDIILSDQKSYAQYTSTELADTCHISRTTLLRICRKIGLMSFSDLKVILKNSSETQAKSQKMDFDYICNIYHNLIDELNKFSYEQICQVLYEAETIYIYGTGNEQKTLADEFKRIFLFTGKLVIEVFDYGEMEFVRKNFKRTDLFVIISLSGETKEGIRILNAVIPTGVRLLSITRLQSNTISGLCDYNLYVATQVVEQQSFYELISAFYILLDLLFLNYLEYVTEVENYEL